MKPRTGFFRHAHDVGSKTIEGGNAIAERRAAAMRHEVSERVRRQTVPAGMVEVELFSTEPSAVEATRKTIEALRGGSLLERQGRYFVPDGFVAWGADVQGYVKRLMR